MFIGEMKTITIELEDSAAALWKMLPAACQNRLTTKALTAILNGDPYPTGPDQLELAIDLAESGVDADLICKLSRLDRTVFEGFMP